MQKRAVLLVYLLLFFGGIKAQTLQLNFNHFVNDQALKLDSATYKNELGQTFTVSKFKYYISSLHFKTVDGKDLFINESFLINEEDEASKKIVLKNLPARDFTSLDFIIGVDSLHNCSGAQSGALDPINAMFWAWNTGYIFLKLEGKASASKSPGNFFEYHIGGYKQPNNCIRKVSLDISNKTSSRNLDLKVDILEILRSPTTIDFEKLSSVTDHRNAVTLADNYSDMFEVLKK
jgi:hypothetical protein